MSPAVRRLRVEARGAVQGVGFRPFVHRLATELGLGGFVLNSTAGAEIEVEGAAPALDTFLARLRTDKPPLAAYHGLEHSALEPIGHAAFEIRESETGHERVGVILPDIATCADCLREMLDPADRRYLYPFLNCTNCGPRFSIVLEAPWDRPRTTMRAFELCEACRIEYEDPRDRRFHAQPVACPDCGPRLELWSPAGASIAAGPDALRGAVDCLRGGAIVALKGLGGFHLVCDARSDAAVGRLRERKHREEKPFAVMTPSLDAARGLCQITPMEATLLASPAAPIVLLAARGQGVSAAVAPRNPRLGVMLAHTPLHHLLLREHGFPVVATSGNVSDEPVCFQEQEAIERLGEIADVFLVHNRPIARPVEDSVARVIAGRVTLLRRSRGYAPLPLPVARDLRPVIAAGAHQKNAIAVSTGSGLVLGAHLGDLGTVAARTSLDAGARDLTALFAARPVAVAVDAHSDYASSVWARTLGLPVLTVQHHFAHVLSCLTENQVAPPALGIAWDGAGLGPDGTIWGGEFLVVRDAHTWERVVSLRQFSLAGGERAAREPRRAALGLAFELFGESLPPEVTRLFGAGELRALVGALRAGVNAPRTSSVGRLFDGVAALVGLRSRCGFEGQAAMELEFAAERDAADAAYPLPLEGARLNWEPMLCALLEDVRAGVPVARMAAMFHHALAAGAVTVALQAGLERVVLSGGCFQNAVLTGGVVIGLERAGFQVSCHQRVPPNDGGLALGQAVAAGS